METYRYRTFGEFVDYFPIELRQAIQTFYIERSTDKTKAQRLLLECFITEFKQTMDGDIDADTDYLFANALLFGITDIRDVIHIWGDWYHVGEVQYEFNHYTLDELRDKVLEHEGDINYEWIASAWSRRWLSDIIAVKDDSGSSVGRVLQSLDYKDSALLSLGMRDELEKCLVNVPARDIARNDLYKDLIFLNLCIVASCSEK